MTRSASRRSRPAATALVALSAVALAGTFAACSDRSADDAIRGFSPEAAATERALEAELASRLSRDSTAEYFKYFTAEPHPAGSPPCPARPPSRCR